MWQSIPLPIITPVLTFGGPFNYTGKIQENIVLLNL